MGHTILLDKFELADYLGCHPYHIWRLVREGRLPQGERRYGYVGLNLKAKYWDKAEIDKALKRGI